MASSGIVTLLQFPGMADEAAVLTWPALGSPAPAVCPFLEDGDDARGGRGVRGSLLTVLSDGEIALLAT